ncbi:hypothetical protein [Photobacterium sp.]|uniref:hypothetical protein n=1 Tax=Photobacterium sp. TaxID=660 RepID=UPI00299D37D3|nr:hypothetical protein [Photobacterium sp.]MDX1304651.1 hypothetical protein [Photobacterium sp.]
MQCNQYQPTAYTKQKCPLVSQPIDMGVLEHVMIDSQLAWYNQYNYLNPRQEQFSAGWLKRYRVQKNDFPEYWPVTHQVNKTGWDEDKSQQSDKMFTEMFIGCFSFPLAWLGLAWLGLAWLGLAWLGLALDWCCVVGNSYYATSSRIISDFRSGTSSTSLCNIYLVKYST